MLESWHAYDAYVSHRVFAFLRSIGFTELRPDHANKITGGLPLVQSPTPMLTLIGAYLLIVLVGLAFLKGRKQPPQTQEDPPWLKVLIQVHNIILIALSAWMAGSAVYWATQYGYRFWGNGFKASERELGMTIYVFYLSKFYEFFDTFIMLLKGKSEQLSLLHVYHHASISSIWWAIVYAAPGGDAYYSCALNSFVHVLMYTHYLLAAMLGKNMKARRKYLWWSRYLTQFQMFQFVTMMIQAAYCFYASPYPRFLSKLLFIYMITLLALFMNFYIKKHSLNGRKTSNNSSGRKTD